MPQYFKRQQTSRHYSNNTSGFSLEDIVKQLISNTLQFQKEAKASIRNIEFQVSQLETTVNKLEAQVSERLHSPPEIILQNVSAMSFAEAEIPEHHQKEHHHKAVAESEGQEEISEIEHGHVDLHGLDTNHKAGTEKSLGADENLGKNDSPSLEYKPVLPFPQALIPHDKDELKEKTSVEFEEWNEIRNAALEVLELIRRRRKFFIMRRFQGNISLWHENFSYATLHFSYF